MTSNMLNLDMFSSINHLGIHINTKYMGDLIFKLIDIVKKYGKNLGILYRDTGKIYQYTILVKYLKKNITLVFEFDTLCQFIYIVYYNDNYTKTYLKLYLSINDEPTIKYIENDRSGYVPDYKSDTFYLKPGEYLVNLAHCLLAYIGFNRSRLDDDSYLITTNKFGEEIRTKLWLYYLIKNGKSWYSKFGYEPGNCSIHEYNMMISDVKKIKLQEIYSCLLQILSAPNKHYFDENLINISQILVSQIYGIDMTIYEYTINHNIEDFSILTNNLMQSVFSRNVSIEIKKEIDNTNEKDNDDSDSDSYDNNAEYYSLEFSWFNIIKKLLVANVIQINNDIKNNYYSLKN